MNKLKISSILILTLFIFSIIAPSCQNNNKNIQNNKMAKSNDISAQYLWTSKIRFLSDTNCKEFENADSLDNDYLISLCQYYESLSPENLEYDDNLQKYIISDIKVKDILNNLLGIKDFDYTNSKKYLKDSGMYVLGEYESYFIDRDYDNMKLETLDDERIKIHVTITDNKLNKKYTESYLLKLNDNNEYYITSLEKRK